MELWLCGSMAELLLFCEAPWVRILTEDKVEKFLKRKLKWSLTGSLFAHISNIQAPMGRGGDREHSPSRGLEIVGSIPASRLLLSFSLSLFLSILCFLHWRCISFCVEIAAKN